MSSALSEFLFGVLLGASGLVPFIHANTIIELTNGFEFGNFPLFAVALVFTRIPFEFVANAKFRISGEESAVGVAEYGKIDSATALEASLAHALPAIFMSIALFPLYSLLGNSINNWIGKVVPVLLLGVFTLFIAAGRNKTSTIVISLLAGVTGVIVLGKSMPNALFILLTGLYALPALLVEGEKIEKGEKAQCGFFPALVIIGSLIGMSSAFLPAMTPTMLTVIALGFMERKAPLEFIALNASIIGSRLVSDFAALEFIGKARSGATARILENHIFTFNETFMYLAIGAGIALLVAFIALKICKFIPDSALSKSTKLLAAGGISLYVLYSSGIPGIAALVVCSLVGLTCSAFNTSKAALGSAIMLPSVTNYF